MEKLQKVRYKKIATGVYLYLKSENSKNKKNTYRVRKTHMGNNYNSYFTNKKQAISFYKAIVKH
jgi:hypothetical protein